MGQYFETIFNYFVVAFFLDLEKAYYDLQELLQEYLGLCNTVYVRVQ